MFCYENMKVLGACLKWGAMDDGDEYKIFLEAELSGTFGSFEVEVSSSLKNNFWEDFSLILIECLRKFS